MAADDRDMDIAGLDASDLMHELVGSDHVQSSDANDLLGVKPMSPVDLAHRWHNRVHRVHNQANDGSRAELRAGFHQVLRDAQVDFQEIRSIHTGLAGNPSRNEYQVGVIEALLQLVLGLVAALGVEAEGPDPASHVQMRQIGGNAFRGDSRNREVVDRELPDSVVHSHQHGQRLSNAASATADADLELASGGSHGVDAEW
mmetsp:Transcript_4853/g.11551  ORF Transcript_4853/g.11551 Transcript_4853/m.11551 type:complete len:201 (+) Transcript_4853:553-1155(+)